jgi:hypothetical protein
MVGILQNRTAAHSYSAAYAIGQSVDCSNITFEFVEFLLNFT